MSRPLSRLAVVGIAAAWTSAGCTNDFGLEAAPELPPEGGEIGLSPGGPGGPGGPVDPPSPPNGPWDNLDAGSLPDLYFAVSHQEYDCSTMDGRDEMNWEQDIWMDCPGTYAVIDLHGQVVSEFQIPRGDDESWGYVNHLELRPAGPGQFLALVENYTESGSSPDEDADGFWVSPAVQVWLADAVTGTMTLVVQMVDTGRTALVQTNDRRVRLDESIGSAMIGVWPDFDETKLILWGGDGTCETGVAPLRAVEMGGEATLDWVWGRNELLPDDMRDTCVFAPWNMDEGVDEEGNPSLLLGLRETYRPEGAAQDSSRHRLVAWSPDEGPMWDVSVTALPWPFSATYAGWNGGGALFVTGGAHDPGEYWHVVGPGGVHEGAAPVDLIDVRPGPLLDPVGPTFLLLGRMVTDWKHSIRLMHRDRQVWAIDQLRFGLSPQRRFISDVVLIVPPE